MSHLPLAPFSNPLWGKSTLLSITKGGKEYIEIKYSELLNFFRSHLDKTKPWAEEFLHSLEIQAKDIDDSNYRAMERRFLNAIKQHKK